MKKFISIILTLMLALSAFSYVSCFAYIKCRCGSSTGYFLIPEEKLPNFLGDTAINIDHKCATREEEESYKDYTERMSSSDKTGICIFRSLFEYLDVFNQIEDKVKIVNIMDKALTDQFNSYYQNTIKDAIEENEKLTISDLIEIKKAHQAFPNRFLNVLVNFLETFA